jgi:hypothetical protein
VIIKPYLLLTVESVHFCSQPMHILDWLAEPVGLGQFCSDRNVHSGKLPPAWSAPMPGAKLAGAPRGGDLKAPSSLRAEFCRLMCG